VASAGTTQPSGASRRAPSQAPVGGVGGPLGDRGDRPGAGQDRGGYGEDRDQRVAAPTGPSRVTDRGEGSQQVRPSAGPERVGVGELGEGGWDRG
jgi:hypothetical protein